MIFNIFLLYRWYWGLSPNTLRGRNVWMCENDALIKKIRALSLIKLKYFLTNVLNDPMTVIQPIQKRKTHWVLIWCCMQSSRLTWSQSFAGNIYTIHNLLRVKISLKFYLYTVYELPIWKYEPLKTTLYLAWNIIFL